MLSSIHYLNFVRRRKGDAEWRKLFLTILLESGASTGGMSSLGNNSDKEKEDAEKEKNLNLTVHITWEVFVCV